MNAPADDLFAYTKVTPESVLDVLRGCVGPARGVSMVQLAVLVTGRHRPGDQRQVRHVIEALRKQGHRICAHPATGYYLAETDTDMDATCEFLYARAMTSLQQISAMKRVALPDLRGQLQLPPIADDDELPPVVGEKLRDVLAERAIATLADNEDTDER